MKKAIRMLNRRYIYAGICVVALCILGILCYVESVSPMRKGVFFILLAFAVVCMSLSALAKNKFLQGCLIAVYSLTLPLAGFELYYANTISQKNFDPFADGPYKDAQLGYRLVPGVSHMQRTNPDIGPATDVVTTIGPEKRRATPHMPEAETAVALFGCSFAFGALLSDEETCAWLVGQEGKGQYQVFNYGTPGWGTHQVYTLIKNGLPELASYKKVHAFYIAIVDHPRRVSGLVAHDRLGPRYFLEDGKLVHKGTLSDPLFPCPEGVHKVLLKSKLYQRILSLKFTLNEQIAVTEALIRESARAFKQQFPNGTFTVIEWPYIRPRKSSLRTAWHDMLTSLQPEIPVYFVEDWLPDYATCFEKYHISDDTHPNALANKIVAEHLLTLLKEQDLKDATER